MKNLFKLEIISTTKVLNKEEQALLRNTLKPILKWQSIKSMCLEEKELFIEYNPDLFNLESFKMVLIDIGFPLIAESSFSSTSTIGA
ncbi:MAG: hypothetical protein C0591_09545 [Marinilabiliales bacterium]|nr:MAG: hypothetical protein C0591_09545 [Marinilabiliales bacterium]